MNQDGTLRCHFCCVAHIKVTAHAAKKLASLLTAQGALRTMQQHENNIRSTHWSRKKRQKSQQQRQKSQPKKR